MPKISVVIPAYNAEVTIKETINSLQQQTFTDFEIIVINDGSVDRTLEILENLNEPRLQIFSYQNGGLPTARNRGISHGTGEFIAFLDADDLWTPDKLELQLAALQEHPEAGVAYSWTYFIDEKGEPLYSGLRNFFEGNVYADLLVQNFLQNGSNPLISREAIESVGVFNPLLKSCEDWDFYLRLAAKWNFAVVPQYQVLYRQSSRSMSSKVDVIKEAGYIMIENAFKVAPEELQYLKKNSLSLFHHYCAELHWQHSNDINIAFPDLVRYTRRGTAVPIGVNLS